MKQNPCTVVGEVAKPTGIGLDELNCTVEAFCAGIADSVLAEVQQSFLVTPEHLDDLFNWLQLAAHRVVRPGLEEAFGCTFVAVAPESREVLLDAPSPARLQVELVQRAKRHRFSAPAIGVILQPCPFAARQRGVARFSQRAVLLASSRVHRLAQVFGDVKLVMHDVCLGQAFPGCAHVRRPHVHGHRLDRCALAWRERLQQTRRRLKLSARHQVQHPRAVNVGHDTDIGVPLLGTLLIDTQVDNLLLSAAQHAALDGADHDGVDRTPGQPRELAHGLGGGTGLEQFDDKAGHQCSDPAVALCPGHGQLLDRAVAVFELGNAGFDEGLELAGIKVTPLAFAPAVDVSPLGRIGRICPDLPALKNYLNDHLLVNKRQINLVNRPRRLQSKKLFVQRGVFHGQLGKFENQILKQIDKNHS